MRHASDRCLDQSSPTPLFHQLVAHLRDDILQGVYRPHDQLPSEPALCRSYQVSRATVRAALDKLVEQRLIYRRHGKGTFVSQAEPQLTLLTDPSFAREMRIRGVEPSLRTLESGRRRMPASVARWFPGTDGSAYFVKRLMLGDGEPWGIVRMYFHPALELASGHFETDELMIDILLDARNVRIVDASYLSIEPVLINEAQAQQLKVDPGSPGLDVARLLVDQTGRIAVHARALFRGDCCRVLFSSREARALEATLAAV
jgi:GntR family transcriptional regulator